VRGGPWRCPPMRGLTLAAAATPLGSGCPQQRGRGGHSRRDAVAVLGADPARKVASCLPTSIRSPSPQGDIGKAWTRVKTRLVDWTRQHLTVALLKALIPGIAGTALAIVAFPWFVGALVFFAIAALAVYSINATRLLTWIIGPLTTPRR
jgi:hypothetical protein